ncbi:hypothetical protein ACP2W0_13775 [Pseudobacillus badius]|uniref:hypothetical protein n=1 Tax=Bacillus badius TaxID=1455 RepID=UPI0024A15B4E|nr:hypothetical protein [Bacillus badius]GLY11830.1 hypothetical protein Bbad01_30460 [Bacillus badius]
MIKSVKGQLILWVFVAASFIYQAFHYMEFTGEKEFRFSHTLAYVLMILSVYNAGMFTQKFIQSKKQSDSVN